MTSYQYDVANRLVDVNGVIYTWDNNGNLLSDGVNTDTYDSANRLNSLSNQSTVSSYQYNGLGDRLTQTVNGQQTNYALDLNPSTSLRAGSGLTQVLNDGTNNYLYGVGRIAQVNVTTEYFLGDALGSVRQLTDAQGAVTLAKSYQPYGETLSSAGNGSSPFAFTGEQTDVSGMTYLRARYYSSGTGRFLTRDTWMGEYNRPLSLNRWVYVEGNPVNLVDPTGMKPGDSKYCSPLSGKDSQYCNNIVRGINPEQPMMAGDYIVFDQQDSCYTPPLQDVLPHVPTMNTPLANGWWFHYLLDKSPGFWNNYGKDHVYFSHVIGFALGAEMAQIRDYEFGILLAMGFAKKGWEEGMYLMLGGRQSAYERVYATIRGSGTQYLICGKTNQSDSCINFNDATTAFATMTNNINLTLKFPAGKIGITNNTLDLGHMVLWRSSWRSLDDNAPYEWGNPTNYSANFPRLMNALSSAAGPNYNQVLYHSVPNQGNPVVAFVVSKMQLNYLCGGNSCVAP